MKGQRSTIKQRLCQDQPKAICCRLHSSGLLLEQVGFRLSQDRPHNFLERGVGGKERLTIAIKLYFRRMSPIATYPLR